MNKISFNIIVILVILVSLTYVLGAGFVKLDKQNEDYIKWVDCRVPYLIMKKAYEYHIKYYGNEKIEFDFVKALAYLATKNGNKFSLKTDMKNLEKLEIDIRAGKNIDSYYAQNKYYKYYLESYSAIFAEMIGEYITDESPQIKYGLKNYHPFAKGYWYSHYDDFGASRSYGFKRRHLGHDLMGSIGTPIVAIEGGTISEIGWNKYGGWRIGVRSFDKRRSYYYAHLRKNRPYVENLKKGDTIKAGQVIGYLGLTGYSSKENVNMKTPPHLHLGMQLIFNETQVQGPKEIWIDMYQICMFLSANRAEVVKEKNNDYKSIKLKYSLS